MSREASAGTGETAEVTTTTLAGSGEATAASSTDYVKECTEAMRARDYPKSPYPLKFPVLVAIRHDAFARAKRPHIFITGKINSTEIIDWLSTVSGDREHIIITTKTLMALTPSTKPSQYKFTSCFGEALCIPKNFQGAEAIFFLPDTLESVKAYKEEGVTHFAGAVFYTVHYDARTGSASLRSFNEDNLRLACAQEALPVAAQKPATLSLLGAIKTPPAPTVSAAAGAGLFVAAPAPAPAEAAGSSRSCRLG